MADALISPTVGISMAVVSGGILAYSVAQSKKSFDSSKVPLMGVLGAFVFAAQMINFAIPATGSSGHIGGAILLSALLGSCRAFIVMACVLAIQAFLFADGGILALGCNIFNMGFWGCFIAYPLIFRPILNGGFSNARIMTAAILACVVSLQLGAFSVTLQTLASDITELPFAVFASLMQPIHLAIGLAEGVATGTLLIFLYKARPQLLEQSSQAHGMSYGAVLTMLALASVVISAGLSLLASSDPDGLEWAIGKTAQNTEITADTNLHKSSGALVENTSMFADYTIGGKEEIWRNSVAGVAGTLITLGAIFIAALATSKLKAKPETNVR